MTGAEAVNINVRAFLLTRPSRDVTETLENMHEWLTISTHTSLAGRDIISRNGGKETANFYSHVPRGT